MTAQSGEILGTGAEGAAPGSVREHVRQGVASPPLAPAIERANPRGLHLLLIVAILVTAGLAGLLGAPIFITVAILLIGAGTLLLFALMLRADLRLAVEI